MSKQEIKEKLDTLGIKYDGRWSEAKLVLLLPQECDAKCDPVELPDNKEENVVIENAEGKAVRIFSKETHGEEYKALATQFIEGQAKKGIAYYAG